MHRESIAMTFSFIQIMSIIFIHWIADFIFQTHWMATNKSKSNIALGLHVFVYSFIVTVGISLIFGLQPILWAAAFCFIFLTHFATDYVTSRMSSYLYAKGDFHNFFVVIGFDQILHYAQLFGFLILI